ncbi:MAG: hypothetical protein UV94_C0041G0003 [Parcubacteria group bacterium GW2011_GWC1_43_30]|nr:MAG: hypothetical protein UV94_C0041G0003 [Parcubacteria group bacterium GW2011_GWC1_43_30]
MATITIPQKTYQELVKKAQIFERFRAIMREDYPVETKCFWTPMFGFQPLTRKKAALFS